MTDPLTKLRKVAARLAGDPDPDVQDASEWAALGARGDLLVWLGAENSRGHSARRDLGTARRNSILREAAARFFPRPTRAEVARILAARLADYHDTHWRQSCVEHDCPHPPDTLHAALWHALKAWPSPVGERQMERIFSG